MQDKRRAARDGAVNWWSIKWLLATAVLLFPLQSYAQHEEEFSQTLEIGESGSFELSNVSGDIEVSATSGTQVVIRAVKRAHGRDGEALLERVEIDVSHHGDRVDVETRHPGTRSRRNRGGVSVDYNVSVPRGTDVSVTTVSGDVRITGVEGETSAQAVSGSVRVAELANLVEARAVSGDVELRNVRSRRGAEIASVSGDVVVDGIETDALDVSSVSGEVEIRDATTNRVNMKSVSGDIRYDGGIASGGRYEFKSHSGDVVLRIDEGVGFELETSTFSGDVDSDFDLSIRSMRGRGRKLEAVVGDGGAIIEATTFSGDLELRRR
jgi:DUF4097 and DUF4098 domain-containing protein YvlB